MRLSNQLVLASTNRDKFEEFKALLAPYGEITLTPIQKIVRNSGNLSFAERHDTYLENAMAKARLANTGCHYPILSDDSGLEVDCLKGKPGVRSHRYATPKPGMSQDEANVQYLLSEIKNTNPNERTARFKCTVVLLVEGIMLSAEGTLEGTIIEEPRGSEGFGYDPVFVPKGATKTLAEMSAQEKNAISHRALALKALMSQVEVHGIALAKP